MTIKLVRDLMHIGVVTCRANTPLAEGARILLREQLESLIVLDDNGHAAGFFTRQDVMAAFGRSGARIDSGATWTVTEIMRPDIPEIPPDIPVTAAVQIMLDRQVRDMYLLHHDGGIRWPAAVLRFEDVLRYMASEAQGEPLAQV